MNENEYRLKNIINTKEKEGRPKIKTAFLLMLENYCLSHHTLVRKLFAPCRVMASVRLGPFAEASDDG